MKKSLHGTFLALIFITAAIAITGCKKSGTTDTLTLHTAVTNPIVSQLTSTSATIGGLVYATDVITANGVCWSATNQTPTISDTKTTDTIATRWISKLAGLIPNTTYYSRAYATGTNITSYGDVVKFTTNATAAVLVGTVTTIAGNPNTSGYADGAGTGVMFDGPEFISYNTAAGLLYVTDNFNNLIRTVTTTGTTRTLTNPAIGFANGTLATAQFYGPKGMSFDAQGNTYVADIGNNMIRKITAAGVVTTLAGNGTAGYADGITTIEFYNPQATVTDATGNVYVSDRSNGIIRKITPAGVTSTYAGLQAGTGYSQSVVIGYADGASDAALFNKPTALAIDASGSIFIVDSKNYAIRKLTTAGVVSTVAGGKNFPSIVGSPSGVAVDAQGDVFVVDNSGRLFEITPANVLIVLAGAASTYGYADGVGAAAKFNNPQGLTIDAQGNLYVADFGNNVIRKVVISRQ